MSQQVHIQADDQQPMSEEMIDVRNLKTYYEGGGIFGGRPVKAVDGVSFSINKGETLGLVGESGCGKTTLGRTLMQLEDATAGEIYYTDLETVRTYAAEHPTRTVSLEELESSYDPLDVFDTIDSTPAEFGYQEAEDVPLRDLISIHGEELGLISSADCVFIEDGDPENPESISGGFIEFTRVSGELQRTIRGPRTGMVFQDPDSSLNDRLTVGEIIREPLDVHDWGTKGDRRERVQELLETVGLGPEHYYRYPHQFSGGQRQRVGIARTLALEPDFIVLDEPVSALDVSVQAEIINLLEDLQEEFGLTYLFIAHDLSVVRHICDRVAVMYLGNIMEIGPTESLFTNPSNPYTHALLSAIPEPDPTVDRQRIMLHGTPPNPRYPPEGCPFSTRCPARIRPPEYEDLDNEIWVGLTKLREILRERERAERSVRERIREKLGKETRFGTMDETYDELFGELTVPRRVEEILDSIAEDAQAHDESAALDTFAEEFGSICDGTVNRNRAESEADLPTKPELHTISETGCKSYCHRHDPEFRSADDVLEERHK